MQKQNRRAELSECVALIQGIFYLVTGIWPLVHMRSFEWVTGPKTDRWLVNTAGVLIAVVGAVLTRAGLRREMTSDIRLLAAGSAAGLASIDVVYVARRRIPKVYLLDAFTEGMLMVCWVIVARTDAQRGRKEQGRLSRSSDAPSAP